MSLSDYIETGTDGAALSLMDVVSDEEDLLEKIGSREAVKRLCDAALGGNVAEAARLQAAMEPLNEALFLAGNPTPVKAALAEMGLISSEYRLPLVAPKKEVIERVRAALPKS